jgi:hypothetical protein
MLLDIPVRAVSVDQLHLHIEALRANTLVVGSVEFAREAMDLMGIAEPENLSYPSSLSRFLMRDLRQMQVGDIRDRCFVKPVQTKRFTGFVYDPRFNGADYSEHDREQLELFQCLPTSEVVWVAAPVKFIAEWRCYVLEGRVVGLARYDPDGPDNADDPAQAWLNDVVSVFESVEGHAAYSLDIGLLDDGRYALVECNDAWALGLYGQALDAKVYLQLLWARWHQLLSRQRIG